MATQLNIARSDLEDLALELGASVVREDGSVFNAAGRSGVSRLPASGVSDNEGPTSSTASALAELTKAIIELTKAVSVMGRNS